MNEWMDEWMSTMQGLGGLFYVAVTEVAVPPFFSSSFLFFYIFNATHVYTYDVVHT